MRVTVRTLGIAALMMVGVSAQARPGSDCDGSFSGIWNFKDGRAMTVQISGGRNVTVVASRPGVFTSTGQGTCVDGDVSFSGGVEGNLSIRRDNITGMVGGYAFNGVRDGSSGGDHGGGGDHGHMNLCDSKINGTWNFDRKPRWYNMVLDTGRRGRTIVYISHKRGSSTVEGQCRENRYGASLSFPGGNVEIDRSGSVQGTINGYPYTGQVQF